MNLFLSPHNDDETLFGAFTIQRDKPLVVVVFDSFLQGERGNPVTAEDRRGETRRAMLDLVGTSENVRFAGIPDKHATASDGEAIAELLQLARPWRPLEDSQIEHVFAPAIEVNGHEQHNAVGLAADLLWPGRVTHYLTYTRDKGKSWSEKRVVVQSGEWIQNKLRALACYETQIDIERLGCRGHFMRDLHEYYQ